MHATLPLLEDTDFPPITRGKLTTLQVNLGYKCNQTCLHCHVNAGPNRKEVMSRETIDTVLSFLDSSSIELLDLTGGAPELNPGFRYLVSEARQRNVEVMDRCNLTILSEPGQQDTAEFLAENAVQITASLPCYLGHNVDNQRGDGVFERSIAGLKILNQLGYGQPDSDLKLNLVFNPQGPMLPPPQSVLVEDYKRELSAEYGIEFNELFTITNMPIKRFGSTLISRGQFDEYMALLRGAYQEKNLDTVMCRNLISVDWRGYVHDCDFNQMLDLPLEYDDKPKTHLSELVNVSLEALPIVVKDHCYGCTAGQGSSCGGALS